MKKKLLHIIATPRGEESYTLQISRPFLETFRQKHPEFIIDELDLAKKDLPSLTVKSVSGKYVLLQGKDLFGQLKESWTEIIQYIEQFLSSDLYLISTPMWNFDIPYMLKQYIDLIVQPKYLFRYTKSGVEGLVINKKMVVITSRGGFYNTAKTQALDFQEPYLREIFGFVGIKDFTFIKAEGMDMGNEEMQKQNIREAISQAQTFAANM